MTHVPKNIPRRAGSRSCQKARKPNLIQATLGPVGPQMWSHALATNSRQYWHFTCVLGDSDPYLSCLRQPVPWGTGLTYV